jgi:serine/threonine protein kinase
VETAKDFIKELIVLDPERRLTAEMAFQHPVSDLHPIEQLYTHDRSRRSDLTCSGLVEASRRIITLRIT